MKQEIKFNYLGSGLPAKSNIENEVKRQVAKANTVAGSLNKTIWRDKHLQAYTTTKIYKAIVRPIMTYDRNATIYNQHTGISRNRRHKCINKNCRKY